MTEPQTPETGTPQLALEIMPVNSKAEIFRKKMILGGVMFGVIMVCTLIATTK